ncbi:MAG: DnaD domain protein [Firmicutes bacterium]|nr:DnaD domain protein [Bacillota bacterium]
MPALFFSQDQYDFQIPVSDQFILHAMPEANGIFVKVYLYTFRCFYRSVPDFSTSRIAEALHMLESEVLEALNYWQKQGLLTLKQDGEQLWISFTSSTPNPPHGMGFKSASAGVHAAPSETAAKVIRVERKPVYSPEEIDLYCENPIISGLFKEAQKLLGMPLGPSDMMILFSFYDYYRLSTDVILYLIRYSLEGGNRSFRYMEKIAEDWSDHQIETVEQAESYTLRYRVFLPIFKALGIPYHNPNRLESESIDRWLYQYGFTMDLVIEAAKRTISSTGKPSFKYMEGILRSWYQQQVKTLQDVNNLDAAYRDSRTYARQEGSVSPRKGSYFVASNTPYYDYDTYENVGTYVDEDADNNQ